MAARKSSSGSRPARRRKPTSKSARKSTRKKTAPRRRVARKTAKRRSRASRKKRGLINTLCGWPFRLVDRVTFGWHPIIKWPTRAGGYLGVVILFFLMLLALFYYARATRYDLASVAEMPARTMVYARDGRTELGRLHGDNRYIVKYDQVAKNFRNALVSREDARFYDHFGIDFRGVIRASVENIKRRRLAQGGSTITIQLAENTWFSPDAGKRKSKARLIDQKLLEMALAWRIERNFDKSKILEHYMNRIFWGHSIRGVESASRTYFEKSASKLSLSEAAMLAGIIRGPNAFSPFKNIEAATRERDVTLGRMVKYEHISQQQAEVAKAQSLNVRPQYRRVVQATYAMDAVRRELDRILEEENIEDGGLTVITTIDHTIQRAAELSVERNLAQVEKTPGYWHQTRKKWRSLPEAKRGRPAYVQGACVVIENRSGAVLGVVGGRSANESQYNRAIQAKRQIGSVFKPFVYLAAFNRGMMPQTWIPDGRIKPGEITGAPDSWSPANSDGKFGDYITAEDALVRSRNTSSVRVGNYAGLDQMNQTATDVGFIQGIPNNPSSYLGTWEATPWQVASAYTVFPNNGEWYRPYIIQEIRNAAGQRVYPGQGDSGKLVISAAAPGASWCVSNTLRQVIERGTGNRVRQLGYTAPCAGKTGTTDDYKDAWFAGYTGTLTCAVWVGMDTPKKIINRGYGSTLAAPIWVDVMETAGKLGYSTPKFKTFRMSSASLCRWSAKRATSGCEHYRAAYTAHLPADMLPAANDYCTSHPLRAMAPQRGQRGRGFAPQVPRAVPVGPEKSPPRAIPLE